MKIKTHSTLFLLLLSLFFIPPVLLQDRLVAEAQDDWYNVAIIAGRGPKTSRSFRISEPQFRIDYSYITSNPSFADFQIFVYQLSVPFESIEYIHESGESKNGFKDIFSGNDTFFISVNTYEIDSWQVTIQQQGIVEQIPIVDYTPVAKFNGTIDTITESFNIPEDHFIVNWNYTAVERYDAEFWVLTYPLGTEDFINILGDFGSSRNDTEYIYTGNFKDFYFLVITDGNVATWELDVQAPMIKPSTISCSVTPTTVQKGSMAIVNGSISPALSGRTVTLTFTDPYNDTFTQTTISGPDGSYSFHFYPTYLGTYSVDASWYGDLTYSGAYSEPVEFTVHIKIPTSITCSTDKTEYQMNEQILVKGVLDPPLSGVNVTLSFREPQNVLAQRTVKTGDDGTYQLLKIPLSGGVYDVIASWLGDETHTGASSYLSVFSVNKISTTLSCNVTPSIVVITNPIDVYGSINPELSGVNVTLTFLLPDATTIENTITTEQDGSYNYTFYIEDDTPIGPWTVYATWDGNTIYDGATSNIVHYTVTEAPPTVLIGFGAARDDDTTREISGQIIPPRPGKIILKITDPNGKKISHTVPIEDGEYSLDIKLDVQGLWWAEAIFEGEDNTHASSGEISFLLTPPSRCFIATAIYGSELSPEVQFLRGFRDKTVLSTYAGSNFMQAFNSFYYSFSPLIASTISSNEALRGLMKIILYPLIGILHLSYIAFTLIGFLPELGIVVAGFVAGSLISLVYLTPGTLLLCYFKKYWPSDRVMRSIGLIWMGSIITMAIAGVTRLSALMMLSTGSFVIGTMGLTSLVILRMISNSRIRQFWEFI